jgi:carbonic anhydrase/acetyltransferase-like protein (isoleucine patch superfamily)
MSVTANLTTNVETITATIVVEDETIIAQVNTAARGPAGEAGPAVINAATTSDGTAALYLDSIRFEATNGGPTQLGEMAWESNDGSIDAMLESGVIVAMGEDLVIRVRNTTASPITKGTALAYDGTSGASGRIEVKPWVGSNIPTAKLFLGFAACDMPANSNGYSQWFGKLTEINTSGGAQTWLDEQIIYAVPGASATITNIAPTSGEYASAAVVINAGSGTSGILFVRPTFEVASSTSATANTLVLRDANGGASFGPLSALAGSSNQHSITSSAGTNIVGPLALSGSTGDTLTATYNAAITLNSTTGVNVNGGPLALTQTWNDAATTYTGLQVNVTDTASAAASLLIDLQADGLSKFRVKTQPSTGPNSGGFLWEADTSGGVFSINGAGNLVTLGASTNHDISLGNGQVYAFRSAVGGGLRIGSAALSPRLHSDSANTLAQRNGTAQQESRIYGTYTGAGDYRRLALKMSSAGVAQIVAEGGGSGASGNRIEIDGLRIGKGGSDVASNTALGASALNANTTGGNNTAVGDSALLNNTTGGNNSAVGRNALISNTTGSNNAAIGNASLYSNTTGGNNSAVGYFSLNSNTTGGNNSAVGYFSLNSNTTGSLNSAVGHEALRSNTTGSLNSAVGHEALRSNTTGQFNSAVGDSALLNNTTGGNNSAVGRNALISNTTGSNNAAIGNASLYSNTTGGNNSAVGFAAGRYIADGTTVNAITNNSVYLGADTKALASDQTNQIVIGHNATGLGSNTAVLGNDSIVTTALKGNVGIGTTSPASKLTVTGGDIEVTDSASGIILKSPDGTRYRVTVSDLGILSTASVP